MRRSNRCRVVHVGSNWHVIDVKHVIVGSLTVDLAVLKLIEAHTHQGKKIMTTQSKKYSMPLLRKQIATRD
jgi:hypothetical protein